MAGGKRRGQHFNRRGKRTAAWDYADKICAAYSSGAAVQDELAGAYGCSNDTIRAILKFHGIPIIRTTRNGNGRRAGAAFDPPIPAGQYVSRDPCPRCGSRADFGCDHSPVRLGTSFSGSFQHGGVL